MSSNVRRLGDTLAERMKKTSAAAIRTTMELGTIGGNLSLTTDSLPTPIPKGDYMTDIMLAGGSDITTTRSLQSGDRVLVAWCGNEPVVVAVVCSS